MLKDRDRFDIVAHFPTEEKAKTAEEIFGGQLGNEAIPSFGPSSWFGLGTGLALGSLLGPWISNSFLTTTLPQALTAQRGSLLGILWAAILGATGWIIGSTAHLFATTHRADSLDLHITIHGEKLPQMRRLLAAGGATAVTIENRRSKKLVAQTPG